jgi:hypothetical protein
VTGWHAGDPQSRKIYLTPQRSLIIYCCPSAGDPVEGVKDTNSNDEGSRGDLSSPIPELEVKSTKVVHELSSPLTEEPNRKRRKGKQKESSRKKLKEYLNNFEDEIMCSMSDQNTISMISTF